MIKKSLSTLILLSLLLTACESTNNQTNWADQNAEFANALTTEQYTKQIQTAQTTERKEENFLFRGHDVTISFPDAIDFIGSAQRVTFLSNHTIAADLPEPQQHIQIVDSHTIRVQLDYKVDAFDTMKIIDKDGQEVYIQTGQFHFGSMLPGSDRIPEDQRIQEKSKHYQQDGENIQLTYTMAIPNTEGVSDPTIRFDVPEGAKEVISEPKLHVIMHDEDTTEYKYLFSIDRDYYKQHNLDRIHFEVAAYQTSRTDSFLISRTDVSVTRGDLNM